MILPRILISFGRSPCGERGLKLVLLVSINCYAASLPLRGAWIEILWPYGFHTIGKSLPLRGAWIEIVLSNVINQVALVAPPAGSVD